MDTAVLTIRAGQRLSTMAAVVLTVYSTLSTAGIAGFVVFMVRTKHRNDRIYSGVGIASIVFTWLFIALLCFAADAIGRHIEHQAE